MAPFGRTAGDENPRGTHPQGSGALPGPAPNTAGPHSSDLMNKLDPTVDAMHGGTQILGAGINQTTHTGKAHPQHPSGTAGHNPSAGVPHATHQGGVGNQSGPPHNSNLANKLDPRVETGSGQAPPVAHTGHGGSNVSGSHYAAPGVAGNNFGSHGTTGNINNGPHDSNLANKLDPRVDTSNPSGGAFPPGAGAGHHTGTHGHPGMTENYAQPGVAGHNHGAPGVGGNFNAPHAGGPGNNNNNGPHNSNLANKLDPRVDTSNPSGGAIPPGATGHHTGAHGHPGMADNYAQPGVAGHNYGQQPGVAGHNHGAPGGGGNFGPTHGGGPGNDSNNGPHNSNLANKLDPRVDTSNPSGGAIPPGAAQHGNYAPHDSRLGNTVDPRFDSGHGNVAHAPGHGHNTTGHPGQAIHDPHPGHSHGNVPHAPVQGTTTIHQGPEVLPGPATKTAGPHSSNLLNKLNPTVDSKAAVTQQREYRTS